MLERLKTIQNKSVMKSQNVKMTIKLQTGSKLLNIGSSLTGVKIAPSEV